MAKQNFMAQLKAVSDKRPVNSLTAEYHIKDNIIVIDELRNLIPPLAIDEFTQLEKNLVDNGIKDPLTVWETTAEMVLAGLESISEDREVFKGISSDSLVHVLVDGHNRYNIAKDKNLDYRINVNNTFKSLTEVKDYMINYQLGRRNLKPEQVSYLRGIRYNHGKKGRGGLENAIGGDNVNVAEILADEYGVSPRTIKRDAEFAQGIDKLENQLKTEVLSGRTKVSKKHIQALAAGTDNKISKERLSEIVNESENEESNNVKKTQSGAKKGAESGLGSVAAGEDNPNIQVADERHYGFTKESNQLLDSVIDKVVLGSSGPDELIFELKALVSEGDLKDKNVLEKAAEIISLLNKKL